MLMTPLQEREAKQHNFDYFFLIHCSIKTNDIDLFKYAIFEICGIFFVANQLNYPRWMTYYVLELENIQNKKPDVIENLRMVCFL